MHKDMRKYKSEYDDNTRKWRAKKKPLTFVRVVMSHYLYLGLLVGRREVALAEGVDTVESFLQAFLPSGGGGEGKEEFVRGQWLWRWRRRWPDVWGLDSFT